MITEYGFSKKLGPLRYEDNQEEVFLGHSVARQQNVSEETAQTIDKEIRRLVDEGYAEAHRILTEKADDLETLAQGLLEFETLSGDEIKDLLKGKRPVREDPSDDSPATPKGSAVPSAGARGRTGKDGDTGLEPQPT